MTDEQLAVIWQLPGKNGQSAETKHRDIHIPDSLNESFSISAFEFEKDYICGIPVSAYIDYNKPLLTAQTVEVMVRYICENAVYDYDTGEYRDFPLPPEASEILSYFDDVKLYFVGDDHFGGSGAAS